MVIKGKTKGFLATLTYIIAKGNEKCSHSGEPDRTADEAYAKALRLPRHRQTKEKATGGLATSGKIRSEIRQGGRGNKYFKHLCRTVLFSFFITAFEQNLQKKYFGLEEGRAEGEKIPTPFYGADYDDRRRGCQVAEEEEEAPVS